MALACHRDPVSTMTFIVSRAQKDMSHEARRTGHHLIDVIIRGDSTHHLNSSVDEPNEKLCA